LAVVAVGAVVDAGPTITLRMMLRLLILSDAAALSLLQLLARNGLFLQLLLLLPLPLVPLLQNLLILRLLVVDYCVHTFEDIQVLLSLFQSFCLFSFVPKL
jgi:hypothetical protein